MMKKKKIENPLGCGPSSILKMGPKKGGVSPLVANLCKTQSLLPKINNHIGILMVSKMSHLSFDSVQRLLRSGTSKFYTIKIGPHYNRLDLSFEQSWVKMVCTKIKGMVNGSFDISLVQITFIPWFSRFLKLSGFLTEVLLSLDFLKIKEHFLNRQTHKVLSY